MLALGDFAGLSQTEIKSKIMMDFEITEEVLDQYQLEIVYMSEENYEGHAFLFMRHKEDQKWYEVQGWHCSCFGFEAQFQPDETMLECILIRKGITDSCPADDDESPSKDDKLIYSHIRQLQMAEEIDATMRNLQ